MLFLRQSISTLATLLFGISASIVLARALGAEALGAYGLAVRLAGLVLAIAQLGIPEVLLQWIGLRRGEGAPGPGLEVHGVASAGRPAAPGALAGTALGLGILACVLVGAVLVVARPLLAESVLRGIEPHLVWLAVGGSILSIVGLLSRRFIQLGGGLNLYNVLDVARTALFLGLAILIARAFPGESTAALTAWLVAELCLAVVAGAYVWRRLAPKLAFRRDLAVQLIVAGAPIQAGVLATFIGNEAGSYVLNAGVGLAAVGVYQVALSVARLVLQVSTTLRTVLQPRLVLPGTDSAEVTASVTRHGLLWMLVLAVGLALGAPLLPLVFGSQFALSASVLVFLLPGMVAYGVMQLLASHLLRIGRRGILAWSSWTFAVASVLFQAVGVQFAGLAGAAAGLSAAYVIACSVVLGTFIRTSGRSARDLVPTFDDMRIYADLGRRLVGAAR